MTTAPPDRQTAGSSNDPYFEGLRRLRNLVLLLIALTFIPNALVAGLAIRNTFALDRQEERDRDNLAAAAWRGCARDQLQRAEQIQASLEAARLPGIRKLFPQRQIDAAIDAKRRRLPLLNCDPNLCLRQPTVLLSDDRSEFERRFSKGTLVANPSVPKHPWRCNGRPYQLR